MNGSIANAEALVSTTEDTSTLLGHPMPKS